MKVTPLDIRRKEFKRSMRGYSDEEVDVFLDDVADEFERLFQENIDLTDRVQRLEEQIAGHAQMKDALEKTLISAQLQADEVKANARKEGELILQEAELKARGIVSESYSETQRVQQALIQLKHLEEDFRFKFRSLLEGHLKLLNEAPIAAPAEESRALAAEAAGEPERPLVVASPEVAAPEMAAPEMAAPAVAASEVAGSPEAVTEPEAMPEAATELAAAPEATMEPEAMPEAAPEAEFASSESEAPAEAEGTLSEPEAATEPVAAPEDEEPTEETETVAGAAAAAVTEAPTIGAVGEGVAPSSAAAAVAEESTGETVSSWPEEEGMAETTTGETVAPGTVKPLTAAYGMGTGETETPEILEEEEPTGGFFFGRQPDDLDDTFVPPEEKPELEARKARDFEW